LDFILGNSEVLEHLVVEMYARGLSTRDVEDCFRDEAGNPMISVRGHVKVPTGGQFDVPTGGQIEVPTPL
jgi:hypothetical protein